MKVLLFASAREAAGGRSELSWSPGGRGEATLRDLIADLRAHYPRLSRVLRTSRIAVNGTYVPGDGARVRLRPRDEVAILPPYSGG